MNIQDSIEHIRASIKNTFGESTIVLNDEQDEEYSIAIGNHDLYFSEVFQSFVVKLIIESGFTSEIAVTCNPGLFRNKKVDNNSFSKPVNKAQELWSGFWKQQWTIPAHLEATSILANFLFSRSSVHSFSVKSSIPNADSVLPLIAPSKMTTGSLEENNSFAEEDLIAA